MDGTPGSRAGRRKHAVTIDEITTTALALIDADGLESLTMRGLADVIGVKPVTLYRYLPNKEAILAEVADRLWRELPPPDLAITGWKEQIRAMWLQLFKLMLRHPHAVPLIARGGAYSSTAGSDTAGMLGVLKDAGFTPRLASEFVHAASALVVGFAFAHLWQHQAQHGQGPAHPAGDAPIAPSALLEYAQQIGPFTTDEFSQTLNIVIDGFADKLHQPS
jgi:TetR/AcrR family tetracycline transcriptional repressor